MDVTDFDDLMQQKGSAATKTTTINPIIGSSIGSPITAEEIAEQLTPRLYAQLADPDDDAVIRASERAALHVAAIFSRFGVPLNLDNQMHREIVKNYTIYELHLALGNEEAGKEYRLKAKDYIVALFGEYPEAGSPLSDKPVLGALTVPAQKEYPGNAYGRSTKHHHT